MSLEHGMSLRQISPVVTMDRNMSKFSICAANDAATKGII